MIFLIGCSILLLGNAVAQQGEREITSDQQIDGGNENDDTLLTRCFGRWGCMSIGEPYFSSLRPISLFPVHPDSLQPQFLLATRRNPDVFHKMRLNSTASPHFLESRPVKIILHGFRETGFKDWIKELIRELLTSEDMNVISVDWRLGASQSYPQAAANTRSLGLVVADFINKLEQRHRVSASDVHIIGYNLGAHAAGYVGDQIPGLGRITGLDPAAPYFEDTDPRVRLDPSDARFVDVIHSDSPPATQVAGMLQPAGHVDFYPTPGWRRTGCNLLDGMQSYRRCKAVHAPQLFTDTVNMDCMFYGFLCDSYANFSSGRCDRGCSPESLCSSMGYKAEYKRDTSNLGPRTFFLEIGLDEPYCRYHYHIRVVFSNVEARRGYRNETGLMFLRLTGTKARTALLQATPKPVVFVQGDELEFVMSAVNLGYVQRVDLLWTPLPPVHPLSNEAPTIRVSRIQVKNLETSFRINFCSNDEEITPERVKVYFKDSCSRNSSL